MPRVDFAAIERKWQARWAAEQPWRARGDGARPKYYALVEFPYPSGEGLHVGHLRSYTAMDIIARKRRMEGYDVLYPIGWDAFGLPAENYALKTGRNPRETTRENISNFRRQLQSMGFSFDWSREVNTTDPAYYKWTQWIFLKLLEHGLAYKARMPINWCPSCKIGLANEEAVGGVCERCGGPVEKRDKEQWMLRITAYAEKLLAGLEHVDYIERAKVQQINWIGRSEGATLPFRIVCHSERSEESRPPVSRDPSSPAAPQDDTVMEVFTTRPDTLFGATYLVLAPEHPLVEQMFRQSTPSNSPSRGEGEKKIVSPLRWPSEWGEGGWGIKNSDEVRAYIERARNRTDIERTAEGKDKTGVELKGIRAINPANSEEIPVWVADYVLGHYGTGAIMAVPAHDARDFAFAKKYGLPVRHVVRIPDTPVRSYLMGADAITDAELTALGITIAETTAKGHRKIIIPSDRLPAYERLVMDKMTPEYWNEYLGAEVVFLFKHRDGRVERIILTPETEVRVDQLAAQFMDETWTKSSPWKWLAENTWYTDVVVHTKDGILVNSGKFTGMRSEDAKRQITEAVGGTMTVTYKLRDWVFSRQRYWGEPIPVVFCRACAPVYPERSEGSRNGVRSLAAARDDEKGKMVVAINGIEYAIVPVPEDQLPVLLPEVERYQPTDTGDSPLAAIMEWVNTTCPKCSGPAKRETDVMPNWAGSSWYFLRYCDPKNDKAFADQEQLKHWMPVDWYNGGMEHTTLHLLYSRFWHRFLYDIGVIPHNPANEKGPRGSFSDPYEKKRRQTSFPDRYAEPYAKRTSHGLILVADGEKMSKSRGNVVSPDEIVERYGADAVRVYEMFIGPFDQPVPWSTDGLVGCRRFLERVVALSEKVRSQKVEVRSDEAADDPSRLTTHDSRLLHKTIKKVTEDIEAMRFNTAVSALMEFTNALGKEKTVPGTVFGTLLTLLAPFAPHLCAELWEIGKYDGSIHEQPWPTHDPAFVMEKEVDLVIQVNGKVRATIRVPADIAEHDARARALAEPNVAKHLAGREPQRIVYIPGKLISIVV